MRKDYRFQTKKECRELLMQRRAALSQTRRKEALQAATAHLQEFCQRFSHILSFASLPSEIDLWPLNRMLASEKKLLLPKVASNSLQIFQVEDLERLIPSKFAIKEPDADSISFDVQQIPCVLVPGVGFDLERQRIGFGHGHYDRLLKKIPYAIKIGIGFREQFIEQLPSEPHDQRLDHIFLF